MDYTIVKFVGIRVVAVHMIGNEKHVWVQPAPLVDPTLVPEIGETIEEDSIFSPIILIQ